MVAILHGGMTHKYLGRKFPGNLNSRTEVEIMHRIQCAWHKFHQHKLILLNKHFSLRLRLKLFQCLVCLHWHSRKNICTNWTWYNGGCWGLLLAGFAYLMNLGKSRCGERTKEWSTLLPYTHCSRGATNILLTNTVWHLRLPQINLHGLLRPLLGCFWMIGCTIFLPHHPETEADRQKDGIRHSHRSQVHILANEIGWRQPKATTNGQLQSQHL